MKSSTRFAVLCVATLFVTTAAAAQEPPLVTIDLSPFYAGTVADHGIAVFAASSSGDIAFECKLQGVILESCTSPIAWSGLAHGTTLLIEVTATDLASGLVGPTATVSAIVDAQAPTLENVEPQGLNPTSVAAYFDSSDTLVEGTVFNCMFDAQTYTPCEPGVAVQFVSLFNGVHELHISAMDAVGNEAAYTSYFEVDASGPVFRADETHEPGAACSSSTELTEIRFFAEDERGIGPISFQCTLDGAPAACSPPGDGHGEFTWSGLPDGDHALAVTAFDGFGNPSDVLVVHFHIDSSLCDSDSDGVSDDLDVCAGSNDAADADGDGTADGCDACPEDEFNDSDGDGSCDGDDECPLDAADDADGDGLCADLDACPFDAANDADGDGVCGDVDSCPIDAANDADGDGVCGDTDSCTLGDDTADVDGDGTADACDLCPLDAANDADADGVCGNLDPCPVDVDDDGDFDGLCADEDPCPVDTHNDADADGICGDVDPCPVNSANDADGDGLCESVDNCPTVSNANQSDVDADGIGDACEPDNDGDGIADDADNCPVDANAGQADGDGDGLGDICDGDDDGDGIGDATDVCAGTPPTTPVLGNGCSVAQECRCAFPWKTHGAYVSCVSGAASTLNAAGKITAAEKSAILFAAGESNCGKK